MEQQPPSSPEFRVPTGPASRPKASQQQQQHQQSGTGTASDSGSTHPPSSFASKVSPSSSSKRVSTGSTSSQAAAEVFRGPLAVPQHSTTAPTTAASTSTSNGRAAVQYYQKPTASQFQFDQTQQMTQTQILEGSDELPDDEVASPLLFGILAGRDNTMHQSLFSHEVPYTFGTSDDCDVPAPGSENTNQVVTTVQVLSSSGLYIDGSLIRKGKTRVLRWGNQIAGGPEGSELFVYTYKLPKDVRTIIATERAKYELEDEELAHGMYSKVYKARDLEHNEVYACKVTNRLARDYNPAELASMEHEIELLKDLSHENIVKFVDVCTVGPITYIFTELIEGVTLHTYYAQQREVMTESDARYIFRQICDAVNYLHMRNIVHRDIKSENVMVTPNNVVKLIDFGLARESWNTTTMLYTFCGTPSYMAPENAVNGNEKNAYGPPVDVWALGVLLFRMLTGRYPFDEKSYANGAAVGKSNAKPTENNTELTEAEVVVKNEGGVKIKVEPLEVEDIPKEMSGEETNMVGVERLEGKIVYAKRKLPSYLMDWKSIVDIQAIRSKEVKELLNRMLEIDPSQRIRIQHVLQTDWICMIDEELKRIEDKLAAEQWARDFNNKPFIDGEDIEGLWGMLTIVPGSIPDAPRRIGLPDKKDEIWMGRRAEMVEVCLGSDVGLSAKHCVISRTPDGVMVGDASMNGTYINSQKIGLGRGMQLMDGDELGLVVPPDRTRFDEDLRDRNHRYLKYTVRLYKTPPVTPDQKVRRQYVAAGILGGASSRPNVRKMEILEIPETGDWPPVDNTWATLAPINTHTRVERLSTTKAIIGRYDECDVILTSNKISRVHCKFEWDEEHRLAYLTNLGQNSVKVNGESFSGPVQLRENDLIHLFSHSSYFYFNAILTDFRGGIQTFGGLHHLSPSIEPPSPNMNSYEDDDIANEVDLVVSAYPVQDDGLDEELLAADQTSQQYQEVQIPDVVKNFIVFFHRNVLENNVHELHSIYEHSFNKLTEKFYAKDSWPEPEAIAPLVNDDQVFLTLYRELYYRHIYSRLTPTIEHRFHSYENYCDLFNYILNSEGPVPLELPNQWLWDIIDEFIYQFQSFCNYRNRIKNKTDEELAFLRDNSQIWSCYSVLNVLYSLIQKSRITEQLLVSKNGGDMQEAAGEYGSRPLYKMLGYFSIVGLLRVHCLLGDFTLALKMMDNIELNKKQALFARVTACHVTTYYYVGFAYMMMRRYADAIKAFSHILTFINRTKQYHSRSYQHDQITKKGDQMYALLTMCVTLCPTRLDENIHSQLREKYAEQSNKLTKPEEALQVFEELFHFACPKFISPNGPNLDDPEVMNFTPFDPVQHYTKIFLAEVRHSILLPTLRSYLKLYTTMGNAKLASFLEIDPEQLRTLLMMSKIRSRQIKWVEGTLLEGEYQGTSDLDFCLKEDMIHIAESKVGRRYGDWFLRNINKFQDILGGLELSSKA
ncbi:hypothetical protein BGZ90_003831 [Linnemannia elongata]|nr:hypothetical protein BGZ90_003831 [Linnemannia elongata]